MADVNEGLLTSKLEELDRRGDYVDMTGKTWMHRAEVLRLAGRDEEAVAAVREALALFERKQNVVSSARATDLLRELGGD